MILHTDFRDYYDNAVGYGVDSNVHFNRFTKADIRLKSRFDFPHNEDLFLLGFCGTIYPMVEIRKYDREYDQRCDLESVELLEIYYAYSYEEYTHHGRECEYSNMAGYFASSQELRLKQFFIDWSSQNDEIFLEFKVPIWIVELNKTQNKGALNPRLKDYGFDRIKNSFTAFQDISMYLSNILVEQKDVAKVEDKFRIEQHGFDLRKSFRKGKKTGR